MRSMLDADIPLNAGCLVPLQSIFSDSAFCDILMDYKLHSNNPAQVTPLSLTNGGSVRWKRVNISAYS